MLDFLSLDAPGKGVNMLKRCSVRRRTVAEIKAQKAEAARKEQEIQRKLEQFDQLQPQYEQIQQQVAQAQEAANIIQKMIDDGKLQRNPDGTVGYPDEEFE